MYEKNRSNYCNIRGSKSSQQDFNTIVSNFRGLLGRLGLPLDNEGIAVVSLVVIGDLRRNK